MSRRTKKLSPIAAAFLLGLILGRFFPSDTQLVPVQDGAILRVVDGDTVVLQYNGQEERMRLLRINTPERGKTGYDEATQALEKLVSGQAIRIEFEEGKVERDNYGRLLGYIFAGDRNVNIEMVRQGWTSFWTRYGEGRYAAAFREAEQEARAEHRGLWALDQTDTQEAPQNG